MTQRNETGLKRVALINDLSCFGKCSLTVSIPILSAWGVEAVPLPTAVLSTHTGGFGPYVIQDMTENMAAFAAHWKRLGLKFDCIYTGFLCSVKQVELVKQFIRDFADTSTLIFVDPVMGDGGKLFSIYDENYVKAMRSLCAMAQLITPNRTEAALLTELPTDCAAEEILEKLTNPNVVITSVASPGKIGYLARLEEKVVRIEKPQVEQKLHGTGDVFASALCAQLMGGAGMEEALNRAADFCDACIAQTVKRMPGHWYGPAFEPVLKGGVQ